MVSARALEFKNNKRLSKKKKEEKNLFVFREPLLTLSYIFFFPSEANEASSVPVFDMQMSRLLSCRGHWKESKQHKSSGPPVNLGAALFDTANKTKQNKKSSFYPGPVFTEDLGAAFNSRGFE